jgi:hypothetical protein
MAAAATMRPRCPHCRADLDDNLARTIVAARADDGSSSDVTLVYCTACGAALGLHAV